LTTRAPRVSRNWRDNAVKRWSKPRRQALLLATLPAVAPRTARLSPDDPDGAKSILALSGTIHYPGITAKVTTTNEDIN
jgi:hypothetical protein